MKIKFTHVEEGKRLVKNILKLCNLFLGFFAVSGLLISIYFGHANDLVSAPDSKILITKFTFFIMCAFMYIWAGEVLYKK